MVKNQCNRKFEKDSPQIKKRKLFDHILDFLDFPVCFSRNHQDNFVYPDGLCNNRQKRYETLREL
jgi:hypothetical protein